MVLMNKINDNLNFNKFWYADIDSVYRNLKYIFTNIPYIVAI